MKIKYLGHATFFITTANGTKIVTDPYEPGGFGGAIGYGPLHEAADIVTVSHEHADHGYVKMVPGNPAVVRGTTPETHREVHFRSLATYHDTKRGADRGRNVVHAIEADGITICHLGDLGHTLSAEEVAALGRVDVLLLPVGGVFTVDAQAATAVMNSIKPRLVIPMHYLTPKCGFNLAPVDDFLAGKTNVRRIEGSELEIEKGTLPKPTEIVVLNPAL